MITSKDAASLWLEAHALFQSALDETLAEWAKPEEEEAAKMIAKVVQNEPGLQELAKTDPDLEMILSMQEGNNAKTQR